MIHIKQTVRSATCSAFILALAALANTPAIAETAAAVVENRTAKKNTVSAVYEVDGTVEKKETLLENKKLSTEKRDESVIGAFNDAQLTVRKVIMEKSGDSSNEDSSAFYGVNAALVATKGSSVKADDCSISTDAEGANAVFATGTDTQITMHNVKIRTARNGSRGLDATYGGTVVAYDADIVTQGAHSAALATDRGGGTSAVNRGTLNTYGEGSPVFYSTGDITAKDTAGYSEESEIGVIEGKNSMTITGGSYTNKGTNAFMLYQSTSGDAEEGTASFTAEDASFAPQGKGAFFYITNTDAEATLARCSIDAKSSVLVNAAGNNSERGWGRRGRNGATFRLTLSDMGAKGSVNCDSISTVSFTLGDDASYTGAIDAGQEGAVSVKLSSSAKWTLTADSYVSELSDANKKFANIKSNGYDVYYDKTASGNNSLKGRTYKLPGGGKLKPYTPAKTASGTDEYDDGSFADGGNSFGNSGAPGEKPGYGEGGGSGSGNLPHDAKTSEEGIGDASEAVDGSDRPDRPQPPKLVSLAGMIKVTGRGSKQTVDLVTKDGKRYALSVMALKGDGKDGGPDRNRAGGDMMPPDNSKTGGPASEGRRQPKQVTADELVKLNGKQVTVRGLFADKDKTSFTVFEYELVK